MGPVATERAKSFIWGRILLKALENLAMQRDGRSCTGYPCAGSPSYYGNTASCRFGLDPNPAHRQRVSGLHTMLIKKSLRIVQPHCLADIPHGFLRQFIRSLASVRDDVAHQRRILLVHLGTLVHRSLFCKDCIDDRLLAVQAADTRGGATVICPFFC